MYLFDTQACWHGPGTAEQAIATAVSAAGGRSVSKVPGTFRQQRLSGRFHRALAGTPARSRDEIVKRRSGEGLRRPAQALGGRTRIVPGSTGRRLAKDGRTSRNALGLRSSCVHSAHAPKTLAHKVCRTRLLAHGLPAMDYFHADRWRRSPGPDAFLREQYRSILAFAQLKRARHRDLPLMSTHRNSITWASASRSGARRWPIERRDWRIHAALAQRPSPRRGRRRRRLGLDLIPSTPWRRPSLCARSFLGALPTTKAAVKMHTLLDLRGNIPSFITSRMASCIDHALDMLLPEPEPLRRRSLRTLSLYVLHQAGAFFVTRAKSNIDAHRVYSPTDRSTGIICDQPSPWTASTPVGLPRLLRRIELIKARVRKTLVFITNNSR